MALPPALRNRLAELIVDAFHDAEARRGLLAVAGVTAEGVAPEAARRSARFPTDLFERRADDLVLPSSLRGHAGELAGRARRAHAALGGRALSPADAPLAPALENAAVLFDAGLFFETHELLEPHWVRAEGGTREALQGLIQVAVGFEHLAHDNVRGAVSLLHDGSARLVGRRLPAGDLDRFARGALGCLDQILALGDAAARRFDWSAVPLFPRA